jgi:hypothetical protein
MTDITNNSDYIAGIAREDDKIKGLVDGITQIIQDNLIDAADAMNTQASILTATGIWLDYWGKRLLYPRPHIPSEEITTFGFDLAGVGFDQAPFYAGDDVGVPITDEVYRVLLIARGGQLLTDGSIPSLNSVLFAAFGFGHYVDHGDMSLSVIFDGAVDTLTAQVIADTDIIIKPCGVRIRAIQVTHENGSFGFDGNGVGFDQQPFSDVITI